MKGGNYGTHPTRMVSARPPGSEWQVSARRYLSEGSMALLNRPDEEVAQPALIAS